MLNKNIPTAMKNPNLSGVIIKQDAGLAFAAGAALLYYGVGAPGLERAPWHTLCFRIQIVGKNKGRVANGALQGLEELPWRTLCARKQMCGEAAEENPE